MAWNEPGGNNEKDPWGGKKNNDGPPDIDQVIQNLQNKVTSIFGGGGSGSGGGSNGASNNAFSFGLLGVVFLIALIFWGFSGIYQVDEKERAVVLRLGKFSETKGAGLHWNPPLIDKKMIVDVSSVQEWSTTQQMLTEDLNIVDIKMSVQYLQADPKLFLLEVRAPEESLQQASNSALRHVVGSTPMHDVLTQGREQVAIRVQQRLQEYLDSYKTGIQVDKVNIEDSDPPVEVQSDFDDVSRAREDEERYQNEAQTYANGIIPVARGEAQRVIEEATAYKEKVIARAEGEAQRFLFLLEEYKKSPEVTRKRLYLDTVQEVMSNSSKVMVDVKEGNNMFYMPLDQITKTAATLGANNSSTSTQDTTSTDVIVNRVLEKLRAEVESNANNNRRREFR